MKNYIEVWDKWVRFELKSEGLKEDERFGEEM